MSAESVEVYVGGEESASRGGPVWVKCPVCSKVKITEVFHDLTPGNVVCLKCHQYPASVARRNSSDATKRYRERTGGAYDKAYNKAVRLAERRLKDKYREEFAVLLAEARGEVGI